MLESEKLILALPKGRILQEVMPIVLRAGIKPAPEFDDESNRQLRFSTNFPQLDIVRVRSFDVATFVAFGAAHFGVAGSDVLLEFNYPEIYAPIDLNLGACRMVVAEPKNLKGSGDPSTWSHVRVATKYPRITQKYFSDRGVQADCIKLSGAIELAPSLKLCRRIVDLVSSGSTLRANGLVEVESIMNITSRLAVNRTAWKTRPKETYFWVQRFRNALNAKST